MLKTVVLLNIFVETKIKKNVRLFNEKKNSSIYFNILYLYCHF